MFIADKSHSRIQVWSLEGDYLSEFGGDILKGPFEIVLCDNFIYISDFSYFGNFLSKWRLDTFTFVKKSDTSKGSELGQLNGAFGLDIDKQEIFVVEYNNKRISVFGLNLEFKGIMANNAIDYSRCLRVRNDTIYMWRLLVLLNYSLKQISS